MNFEKIEMLSNFAAGLVDADASDISIATTSLLLKVEGDSDRSERLASQVENPKAFDIAEVLVDFVTDGEDDLNLSSSIDDMFFDDEYDFFIRF